MKNAAGTRQDGRKGSAVVTSVVMLVIAALTVGAVLRATTTYSRFSEATYCRERAAFLADGGLQAAIVELNRQGDGAIGTIESRDWFARTNSFASGDWGFTTRRTGFHLASTGRYKGHEVTVHCDLYTNTVSGYIHALFVHALYAGNSSGDTNYVLKIGGTGSGADYVNGDTYSGRDIELSGTAKLRLPELMTDWNGDGICNPATDTWVNAYATQVFSNALSQAAYNAYTNSQRPNMGKVYPNGNYDPGEAYVDTIGNGAYDVGEPFVDVNSNGVWDAGDSFIDRNGNGVYDAGTDTVVDNGNGRWDAGEEWTEDSIHSQRVNGRYDAAGGYWSYSSYYRSWSWKTTYTQNYRTYSCASWPAEPFEDVGDGLFSPAEKYTDQNGVYDEGEQYLDDRNNLYDYGTQAPGLITGMPAPGPGQRAAVGGDRPIDPPDLTNMFYSVSHDPASPEYAGKPAGALERWGHDVAVTASDFSANGTVITDASKPEHIFVRNVRKSTTNGQYTDTIGGVSVKSRGYSFVYDSSGNRVDDYFLEDPTDPSYNSYVTADEIDGTVYTAPCYVNVSTQQNNKLYYVDGNVYLHATPTWCLKFRQPGTRITIVAKGNITVSDEFYYNADYAGNLDREDINSTIVNGPQDALCLIALKSPSCTNSGNIYIGDPAMGTGGSIHAMLYAENDFVDNNINTSDQQFISVFGNMTAGNHVRLNRPTSGGYRTRLDISLDDRVLRGVLYNGDPVVPGLPHPVGNQRYVPGAVAAWEVIPGSWSCWSLYK